MFTIIDGCEVSIRSRILPESIHVGLLIMFCRPNSLMISRSLLFAGCSVVSDLLFTPVDIGKVEVSCYDYIWWDFLCSV